MTTLKENMRKKVSLEPVGFVLPKPELHHFTDVHEFSTAVKEQKESLEMIDPDPFFHGIDIDGTVVGTDYRLSHAAFSDLCHLCSKPVPVTFIKNLARVNEVMALDVLAESIRCFFRRGQHKKFVVDSRTNRVEGIVGADSYSPISHEDVIDYALTANPSLQFSNGWLSGPVMRMTATVSTAPVEPAKGDLMEFGVNIDNAIHGDRSVRVCDYALRLSCTNGMTARTGEHMTRIRHVGDVHYNVQRAVVVAANTAEEMFPLMEMASRHVLDEDEITRVRTYLADPKNGGGSTFEQTARDFAMQEAHDEGREEGEVTLWNFVNGVTQTAHTVKSLQRKTDIEALGYATLVRYGVLLVKENAN